MIALLDAKRSPPYHSLLISSHTLIALSHHYILSLPPHYQPTRSLSVMLDDFLQQHKPKLTENERRRLASNMDMRQVSEEYERELRRPIRSLLTGTHELRH